MKYQKLELNFPNTQLQILRVTDTNDRLQSLLKRIKIYKQVLHNSCTQVIGQKKSPRNCQKETTQE